MCATIGTAMAARISQESRHDVFPLRHSRIPDRSNESLPTSEQAILNLEKLLEKLIAQVAHPRAGIIWATRVQLGVMVCGQVFRSMCNQLQLMKLWSDYYQRINNALKKTVIGALELLYLVFGMLS